jgi:hypothetical protein
MSLARIEIEYGSKAKIKELSEEDYAEACRVCDELAGRNEGHYWPGEAIIDLNEAGPVFSRLGIEFKIKKFKGTMPVGSAMPELSGQPVHVHVPNIGLLHMNHVLLLGDCCTDELQRHLDDGWRILCVCPPNSQRRPDYIMGRSRE